MSSLINAREAYMVALEGALPNVKVYKHGGEFDLKQLKAYGRQAPCVILSLLRFDATRQGGYPVAAAHWGLVVMTKNEGNGIPRDDAALDLTERAVSCILPFFAGSTPQGAVSSATKQIVSRNLFNAPLDQEGIAMWGAEWRQTVDLVQDLNHAADFKRIGLKWDLAPEGPDGQLEAEDLIEDLDDPSP
jgi:hypothetical protein